MQQRYYDPGIGRFLSNDPMASDTKTGWNFNRYDYANNNPYRFTDPDGRWAEDLVLGIPSIIMGAKSLADNVGAGNYAAAAVDALGIVADGAAIATPGVPGGAGAMIGAFRLMERVSDMGKFLKSSDFGRSIAGSISKTSQRVDGQSVYKVTDKSGVLNKGDKIYLDGKHKDHFEVYDKNGKAKAVLNMDGSLNAKKTETALKEGRRLEKE